VRPVPPPRAGREAYQEALGKRSRRLSLMMNVIVKMETLETRDA
jgi:hypothetical protein